LLIVSVLFLSQNYGMHVLFVAVQASAKTPEAGPAGIMCRPIKMVVNHYFVIS